MNNKGQTLVLFVFIIPIILLILFTIIDYGMMSIQKKNYVSSVKESITYILNNKEIDNKEDVLRNLILKNIDEKDIKTINVKVDNNKVDVDLIIKTNSVFNILNINNDIKLSYTGKVENNHVRIEGRG